MRAFSLSRMRPLGLVLSLALAYPVAQGLPQGAQVVNGQVSVNPGLIQQSSDKAIINWQSFSIGANETLRIQQPGVNSMLLNRVVGGDPSLILGQMQANGRVFLVNPRGIVFGRGSQVNAGSLVASTLDLSDTAFLAGNYRFSAGPGAGALQADGSINAPGGTVVLVAPQLNASGSIAARRVGLAAASTVQVDVEGDGLVLFNLRNDDNRDVSLKLSGRVQADGSVEARAQARAGAAGQVLNMDGIVQARGFSQQGGRVVIDGGTAGITSVNGSVDASGETGGSITVLGQKLALLDGARLDASGRLGGGSLQVGGGLHGLGTEHNAEQTWIGAGAVLRADATDQGDGGRVSVGAAGRTALFGCILARGGRLGGEGGPAAPSGRQRLNLLGKVDASAPQGRPGQWLLDPNDVVISAGNSANVNAAPNFSTTNDSAVVNVGALQNALTGNTVVTIQTTSSGSNNGAGNIDVQTAIVPTGSATLQLMAQGNISFTGGSIAAGPSALDVVLNAAGSVSTGSINTGGGSLSVSGNGAISLGALTSSALTINGGSGAVTLPSGNVAGALSVATGGTIGQGGALTVGGNATLTTGSAAVTLGTLNSHGLSITTSNGAVSLGGGLTSGNLSVSSSGAAINQTGALTVTGNASFHAGVGGGAITLSQNNDFQDTVTLTGGATRINSTTLKLGAVDVTGLFDASTTGGDIHQLVSLSATTGVKLDAGGGDIVLGNATLPTLTALTSGSGAITLGGNLTANGSVTLAAGSGGVSLGSFSGGGNVNISATTGGIVLGSGSINGSLTASTGGAGAIGQAGALNIGGLATLTAGNRGVTLGSFNSHGLSITATGGGVTLGNGVITGNLGVDSGGTPITQAVGGLTVTGGANFNAGAGTITLLQANDLQGTVTLTGRATQITSNLTAASVLKLGTSNINGALIASTGGGAITQTGTLSVNGSVTLDAGNGAITLGSFNSGNFSATTNGGALTLGTGTVTGTLTAATSGGAIGQAAGGLTVTSTSSFSAAAGDITLDQANDLHGTVTLSGRNVQLLNTGANALTLNSVATTGNLALGTGGGAITLGRGSVTGTLSVGSSGGDISQAAGNLSVSGLSTLNAGSGSIALGNFSSGGLSATTSGGTLTLGTGTLNGTLTAATGGGLINQVNGGLVVTGNASLNAGAAGITLNDTDNDWQGSVTLTGGATRLTSTLSAASTLTLGTLATGNLTVSTAGGDLSFGGGSVGGVLDASTHGGDIKQTGALSVAGVANLNATTSANIALGNTGNIWHGLNLVGKSLNVQSSSDLQILTLTQPSNSDLTLSAGANLILGPAASINTGSANLTLASLGGSFSMGGVLAGKNISLQAQTGLVLSQNITATGTLTLTTAGGNINQTGGSLLVTGATTVSAPGSAISLNQPTNHFNGAVSLTGAATTVTDSGALTLGVLNTTGDVTITSHGALNLGQGSINGVLNAFSNNAAITQTAALSVTGAAMLNAGSADVTLDLINNSLLGPITVTSGAVSLASAGNLNLFALTQAANMGLQLVAGANLILPVGTGDIDTGTAALTLSSGNVFSTFGTLKGGDVKLKGTTATLGHDITASGNLSVDAVGTINQVAGGLSVAGTSSFNSSGGQAITLSSTANQFNGAVSLTGGDTVIRNQGALQLGNGSIVGLLNAGSTGPITQTGGPLSVTNAASFNAGGASIALDQVNNSWGGAVSLTGSSLVLKGAGPITLGNVSGSSLTLKSTGVISQAAGATLGVASGLDVDAGNAAITLANNGNGLGGTVTLKGGDTQLKTSGSLTLGAVDTGNLTVISAGVINLGHGSIAGDLNASSGNAAIGQANGGLVVAGNASIHAGTADITLDDGGNSWTGAVGLTGRDVHLSGNSAIALGSVGIRSLVLKSGGAVTQSSALSLTGALDVDAGNAAITLTDSNNHLSGLVTLKGGATQLNTAVDLMLGQLTTGNLTVTGSGLVNLGQGHVSGNLVANSGNAAITQTAALHVSGTASFNSGTGNITLSNSGNQFNGALSLVGNAVTIYNQPDLHFDTLSFNSLDATSNGSIQLGHGSLSGALTARALGGSITQTSGGLTVAGNATLQASTVITMTEANHFNGTVNLSGGASAITNAASLRLGTLSTAGLTLNVTGSLDLGSGHVGGVLTATSSAAIGQSGALSVTGGTSLDAGSAGITLNQSSNAFTGSVDLRGGGTVITASGALNLGNLHVAGLTASSSGALRLGTGAVGGDLNASGAGISQVSGGLSVSGLSTLSAGAGNIDLPEGSNAFAGAVSLSGGGVTLNGSGALHLGSFTAQTLQVSAGGDLDLGGGSVNGDLTATTRGSKIGQSAPLTVKGVANFVADGGTATLVLDQSGNQLLGGITMRGINGGSFNSANISSALDLSFSGDVKTLTLNSGGLLTLGGGHSTTLTAGAAKGILLTGPLEVNGLMTLVANGGTAVPVDMSTKGAANDFNRVELQTQAGGSFGRVQLRDGDASRHDGLKVSGNAAQLEIISAGALDLGGGGYGSLSADTSATGAAITQSGALTVAGLTTLKAGNGTVTLTRSDNSLPSFTVGSAGIASLSSQGDYSLNASSVSTRLELGGAGAISLVGPLSGSGELVMKGSGSLTMTTAQTYSGGTRIETGTVVLQGPDAQAGSGAVQLEAAGQLDLRDGAVMSAELVAKGGRVLNSSGRGGLSGPVTLQADTRFVPGAGGLTISGAISDADAGFGLTLAGGGTLTLSGSNRYSGVTDISAGTLRATGAGALPSTSTVQLAAGAVLSLGLDQNAGSLSGAGHVDLGSFTLGAGLDGKDTDFSGSLDGSGGLTKLGSGRLTLSGSATYTGATRVAGGELVLASAGALNDISAVTVDSGAALTVRQSIRLGSLAGTGTVDVQAPLLSVGSNGSSTRWDGNITGSGGLAKLGAGVFTLAGHNTLAGDLQVGAGTLQLQGGGVRPLAAGAATGPVVPTSADVDVAGGATLELLTDIDLGALTGAGQVQLNANTLTVGASGRSGRFDGVMAGGGSLTKTGGGTLTLGGANVYTGSTRVDGGLLVLDGAQALAGATALVIEAPGQVQANARQAVASLNGNGALVLNGASLATGADGSDSRFDGTVSGSGGLVKQGAGTLTLTAAHTNSGPTVIEAGTVQLSGNGALGLGEIQNQGVLRLSRSDALTLDQAISGHGGLVITQGQVTLNNGASSYSGATQVQGGTLITTAAERLSDASAVQVAAGAQLQLGGNETIAALQAAGSVKLAGNLTTRAEQVYTGSLTLTNAAGQTLSGTQIDASRSNNQFGSAPLGLAGGQALVTVKESLQLGDVTLSNGGRVEADRLALNGKMQLTGGSLALVAKATPDDAKAVLQGTAQVPVVGQPLALAEATVLQGSAGAITLAEGARLEVQASGGGSVRLAQDANSFKGQLSVLSGAAFNTAWSPNAKGGQAVQSEVRVSGQQVMVGGSGIEADLIYIRADQLATAGDAKLVARMPFDEIVLGKALSAPGMVLELAPGAFGTPGSFGSVNGQPIQIQVGSTETGNRSTGPNAGYVSVLPKAGAQGSTAVVLVGPKVGSQPASGGPTYRFFHDGASQATEIPVVYNGVLPLTPAASGALSSINGDAEDARRARFQETVRTENVTVRLRSGVIAEVGPGRPSTQGSEGAKPPELCDPAAQPVLGCKPANP